MLGQVVKVVKLNEMSACLDYVGYRYDENAGACGDVLLEYYLVALMLYSKYQ